MLFLSYAEEDGEQARKITDWFTVRNIPVYYWEDPVQRGGQFIDQMERQLSTADAFLALVSPHFIESPWCHRETQVALLRETELQRRHPDAKFIRVLRIADTPYQVTGFLGTYDRFDLTDPNTMDQQLGSLMASLGLAAQEHQALAAAPAAPAVPSFRNRDDELDSVLRGVTNSGGPHFWLIIAPPQLGKTWFMDQLAVKLREEPANWSARRVDVRDYSADVRSSVPWLLGHLFWLDTTPMSSDRRALRQIAAEILVRRRPHLCLLDSAELLTDETVMSLRLAVDEIHSMVLEGNDRTVRVAFVAASRRDDEWRRVVGQSRLALLPLSEFKPGVVVDALRDLAGQMNNRPFSPAELRSHAERVHQVSEGLPALLALCLQWIQREQWISIHRLSEQEEFESLAESYVEEGLLGPTNLFRSGRRRDNRTREAVETALRCLVPYRLFTLAHLRYHVESEARLSSQVMDTGWSVERLWAAISDTALLYRPLDEPWQEVQGAIRRLLFRYFYPSDDDRAAAHMQALRFAGIWSDGLTGRDQITGLVECLWHEAAELGYSRAADAQEVLCESAASLVESLKPSSAYSEAELRRSAADRIRKDEEFQDTVAYVPRLFDKLVQIVDAPEGF
jgi:TIR domain